MIRKRELHAPSIDVTDTGPHGTLASVKAQDERASEMAMSSNPNRDLRSLPEKLKPVFYPVDKRAFGFAVAVVGGALAFLATAVHCMWGSAELGFVLGRMSYFFYGYEPTWAGAFIGMAWAMWVGFVGGFFLAFLRNFIIACWLFVIRARAQYQATRNFLDHM